jgi:hypothetical protein
VNPCRIWIGETDVTPWVIREDWPEWLETEMKGPGFFDWSVKSFEFRLYHGCPVAPTTGLRVRLLLSGVERFVGSVDEVRDAFTKTPLVACQPTAVLLKDVMSGTPGVDPATGALHYLLTLRDATVAEAVAAVVERYNANRDPRFYPADDWVVDVRGSNEDPVPIHAPHGIRGPRGDQIFFEPEIRPFPVSGLDEAYLAEYIPTVDWLQARLDPSTGEMLIGCLHPSWVVEQGHWVPRSRYHVARCPIDGIPDSETIPFTEYINDAYPATPSSWWRNYPLAHNTTVRLNSERVLHYTKTTLGLNPEVYLPFMAVVASIDHPSGTWTVVHQPADLNASFIGQFFLVWWGNPLVQRIGGRWENRPMAELIKIFAMVSGRWLRITNTTITMIPREQSDGFAVLPDPGLAIERDRQRRFVGVERPSIQLRDPDPESYGLDFSAPKLAALQYHYAERFTGDTVTTEAEFPIETLPSAMRLLAGAISPDEPAEGQQVMALDFSTDGKRWRYRSVREGA